MSLRNAIQRAGPPRGAEALAVGQRPLAAARDVPAFLPAAVLPNVRMARHVVRGGTTSHTTSTTDALSDLPLPVRVGLEGDRISLEFVSGMQGDAFPNAIKSCAKKGAVDQVNLILRCMQEHSIPITEQMMRDVLQACIKGKRPDVLECHIGRMEHCGLIRQVETYNVIMNACASLGKAPEAEMWLQEMREKGIEPDLVTYSTLCKALAQEGQTICIWRVMGRLEASGHHLTEHFFAALILSCGFSRPTNTDAAEQAVVALIRRGLQPRRVKCALVRALGNGDAEAVWRRVAS